LYAESSKYIIVEHTKYTVQEYTAKMEYLLGFHSSLCGGGRVLSRAEFLLVGLVVMTP